MIKVEKNTDIDYEWVELMQEAKTIGLSIEDIRQFFAEKQAVE